jgi:hypothetical protein
VCKPEGKEGGEEVFSCPDFLKMGKNYKKSAKIILDNKMLIWSHP